MRGCGFVLVLIAACGGSSAPKQAAPENHAAPAAVSPEGAQDAEAARASHDAEEARRREDELERQMEDLDTRVSESVDAVVNAQTDADRQAAHGRLNQLQREQAELKEKLAQARAESAKAERRKGTTISKECQDNPLAKGCM